MICAEKNVLPVIDDIARCLIDEGITPTTESLRLLKERNLRAARSKFNGCRKSAQGAADDDDIDWRLGMKNQSQSPKIRCFTQYFMAIKNWIVLGK